MILAIASGKGGTGKTSVVAWFAALAHKPVLADCDFDLNEDMAGRIESEAARVGTKIVGRIRYDRAVTAAQIEATSW